MNLLERKIIEKIKKEGPITFEAFMDMALYEPGLGYYVSDTTEIGKAGDFYTSPHLHSIFGAMVGKQLEEMWEILGSPADFCVIEVGAGTGYLCKDIQDYLEKKSFIPLSYIIVEPSPFIKAKQIRVLESYTEKVKWVRSLKELEIIRGCVLSNELLDAFPVHIIEMEDKLQEIYVDVEDDILFELKGNLSTGAIVDYINEFSIKLTKGYRTEVNLRVRDWLKSIYGVLGEGFVLTVDYGYPAQDYYSNDRNRGTLLCYHHHQVEENPYKYIGEQDITAHVNFSSVKKWGEDLGLKTLGFCQQGTFLVSLGIDEVINEFYKDSPDYLYEVAKIKRLILPGTMGETHKVMIQYKGEGLPALRGFDIKNQADKL